jgi:hypothetical protein
MSLNRTLITLVCLLLPATSFAAGGVEDRATLDVRWQRGVWAERASELTALARDDQPGFRRELRAALSAPAADIAMQDRLLDRAVLALLAAPRELETRRLLMDLSTRAPRAMTLHEDGGHRTTVPYADPGANARAVLRAWDRFDARDASLTAMARGTDALAPIRATRGRLEDRVRGVELAFDTAATAEVAAQREVVRSALSADPTTTGIATRLALRTGDVQLAREVIERGTGRAQLDLVLGLRDGFGTAQAVELLVAATAQPAIASAAVLQLGGMDTTSSAARDQLMGLLADRALGGSAAQALAVNLDANTTSALGAVLDRGVDDLATRRAILALRLSQNPIANAMLSRYATNPNAPQALRQEVASWTGE